MRANAARKPTQMNRHEDQAGFDKVAPEKGFAPSNITSSQASHGRLRPLRMYTEEEVSEMLQISLSQLRKWRMKQNQGSAQGPPFRKIGRLVRYPEEGLAKFINGF